MNRTINNIIFFVLGAGVGASGAYLYMKDRFDKMMNEEIDDIKAYYEENKTDISIEEPIIKDPDVEDNVDSNEKPSIHSINKQKAYKNEVMKTNYHQFSNKKEESDEEIESYSGEISVIDMDEFNDYNGYIKRTVSYYSENDVLYDEELDEVIDDIDGTLGRENLDNLGNDGDITEIYIRNDNLGTDFEVCLETGEFNPEDL